MFLDYLVVAKAFRQTEILISGRAFQRPRDLLPGPKGRVQTSLCDSRFHTAELEPSFKGKRRLRLVERRKVISSKKITIRSGLEVSVNEREC